MKTSSTENRAILLRYHEVALKGLNRGWFEDKLAQNARKLVQRALQNSAENPGKIELSRSYGRLYLHTPWNEQVREALGRVFGLTGFSPMLEVPTSKEAILEGALHEFDEYIKKHGMPKSFRVLTRRSDKALPEKSFEIDAYVGGEINDRYPQIEVDLDDPAVTLGIEVRFKNSSIWTERIKGKGGLPVGSNAPLLALMSGGLDSPVAAIKTIRRGSALSFLHFYGAPFVGEEVLEKVEDLIRIVNRYQPDPKPLYVIPFGKIQEKIALATHPKMRTILYRRMMVRIGCEVAKHKKLAALVTGESLGQVASQTVQNMATINQVATLPILRPLVAFDKDEIIAEAHRWETFETSVRPGADCCTLFADRHPTLRSKQELVEEQEAKFSVPDLVNEALNAMETKENR